MEVYSPAEDSYLLAEIIKRYLSKLAKEEKYKIKILDVGTGSGIQSKNLIDLGIKQRNIFASDINKDAIKEAKKLGIKTIKSDLFDKIKNKKFSLIIFNPPYLPEDKYDKGIDTTGGKKGDETIIRFVKDLKKHLEEKGVCFLLTSSLTPNSWKEETKKHNFNIKKVKEKNIFFEKLFVWEIFR